MRWVRGRAFLSAVLALAFVLVGSSPAAAQPPSNDDFNNAIRFTAVPFRATADTTEATRAADDPTCVPGEDHTVWYRVRLSSTRELAVDTFGSDYDTTLSAWTGSRGNLNRVACNDDFQGLQSRIRFTAQSGVTYYLMVGSFPGTPGGHLELNGQALPPPMRLSVSLDPNGSVTAAGAAVIHGRVTCSRPGQLTVYGTLRQQQGRRATVGSYRISVACDGTETWRATVRGETGVFRRGSAQAVAVAEFVDARRLEVVRVRATRTVELS
jgi:hypothetical protein